MTVMVTIAHVRRAGATEGRVLCAPGLWAWARRQGLDLRQAAREGVPLQVVEQMDDAFAQRVAALARREAGL